VTGSTEGPRNYRESAEPPGFGAKVAVGWSPERLHELSMLRGLYEELLPPRQREVLALKLDEDLSLSEMAERLGVSRAACEDALRRAERSLDDIERRLCLMKQQVRMREKVDHVISVLLSMDDSNWRRPREDAVRWLKTVFGGEEPNGV